MNVGGVTKACKSNGPIYFGFWASGKRVRNTSVICPEDGYNFAKAKLIPDGNGGT